MDDREILQWDKRLADQVKRGWDNYKHLHIDLGTARIDQSYLMAGEYLYIEESSSVNAIAKIRLNRKSNDALDLEKGVKIETVFIEIFITNDALEGEWLDLVFGINFKYKKKLNVLIGDSCVSAYRFANQVIPTVTWTQIQLDTEIIDRLNEFDPLAYQYTCQNDGEYLVIFFASMENITSAKSANLALWLNGVIIKHLVRAPGSLRNVSLEGSKICQLVAGDILTLEIFHNSGVNKNLLGGDVYNHLQVYRLR